MKIEHFESRLSEHYPHSKMANPSLSGPRCIVTVLPEELSHVPAPGEACEWRHDGCWWVKGVVVNPPEEAPWGGSEYAVRVRDRNGNTVLVRTDNIRRPQRETLEDLLDKIAMGLRCDCLTTDHDPRCASNTARRALSAVRERLASLPTVED